MLLLSIVNLFKYKIVGSIIIIANLRANEKVQIFKQFFSQGMRVTFSREPTIAEFNNHLQGILYVQDNNTGFPLDEIHLSYFSNSYKWLLLMNNSSKILTRTRYDADIVLLREKSKSQNYPRKNSLKSWLELEDDQVFFDDVYFHPRDGVSLHEWAHSSKDGLQLTHDWEKFLRRRNLKKYPFRISAPVAHFSEETYKGTFAEYLVDITALDPGLRCGFGASSLLIDMINATNVIKQTLLWSTDVHNDSMIVMLEEGTAELSGGVLRMMHNRLSRLDYILPIYWFSSGFTYLAERASSSNMYVEPFTAEVWWSCLAIGVILALAQRLTARNLEEKEGAFMSALATWLQQDAGAVPDGLSGRWTFTVLSICSMLVYAYYTSAIVSALMSTGRGGPKSLRALADSRYATASEDHDFFRFALFDIKTPWEDLEYLKRKKLTSKFYQDVTDGVRMLQEGHTAFHAEYQQLNPYLNVLTDDEICKVQHIDTVPEIMTWLVASPHGQWTDLLRMAGAWLQETGLTYRLLKRMTTSPPPCRAAMLAERVTLWDIAPLLVVTLAAMVFSVFLLGVEILVARWRTQIKSKSLESESVTSFVPLE